MAVAYRRLRLPFSAQRSVNHTRLQQQPATLQSPSCQKSAISVVGPELGLAKLTSGFRAPHCTCDREERHAPCCDRASTLAALLPPLSTSIDSEGFVSAFHVTMEIDAASLAASLVGKGPEEREEAFKKLDSLAARALHGAGSSCSSRASSVTAIHVGGLEGDELEDEAKLEKLFSRFGMVVATTLRKRREGSKVSWALVSLRTFEEASRALEGTADLAAQYPGLVTRTVDEVQAVHSTGAMGDVMRQHMHARAERRQQDRTLADVGVACVSPLCAIMCRDAAEISLEEFQRVAGLLLALVSLDPVPVGAELYKLNKPNYFAICKSAGSAFGAALAKDPQELTEAGARTDRSHTAYARTAH
jgi:hypothetical protein